MRLKLLVFALGLFFAGSAAFGATVTFDGNGSTGGTTAAQTASSSTALTANGFTRTNYAFYNWNTASDGSGIAYANQAVYDFAADMTLYAQWGHSVTFNVNSGSGSMIAQVSMVATTLTLNTGGIYRAGFVFMGWNTVAGGTGTAYADGAVYSFNTATTNITLYAQWGRTVSFNPNGGTGTMSPQIGLANSTAALTLNSFSNAGYAFYKWNTTAGGTGTYYTDGAVFTFSTNATLYAQWGVNHTVTFDSNGGTGTMSPQTAPGSTALTPNTFTRGGGYYSFNGWNTAADGSGTSYPDVASYSFAADITLYAQWRQWPTYYIPQVAVGHFMMPNDATQYHYTTTFVIMNSTTAQNTTVTLSLTDDSGFPMTVNLDGLTSGSTTGSSFTFTLSTGESRILQASSVSFNKGAATIASNANAGIGVSGMYTVYNDTKGGKFVTEVGVQGISSINMPGSFVIPVQEDNAKNIHTGIALYNPSYTMNAQLSFSLLNQDGTLLQSWSGITLTSGNHAAFYLSQLSGFPTSNFSGMCLVQSTVPLAATTLRENTPSFATYTSIPVVGTTSTQTTYYFAQLADGAAGGAQYKTTLMLLNFGSSDATVNINAYDASGNPLTLTGMNSEAITDPNGWVIPASQSKFIQTNGAANATGSIVITSTGTTPVPIGAGVLFTQYDNSSNFQTEAGVLDSPILTRISMPIDSYVPMNGPTVYGTAFALFNPSSNTAATLLPRFVDVNGLATTAGYITIQPHAHVATYFDQIFPQLGSVQGTLAISTTGGGVAGMAIRSNASPYNMTSFAAVSGTAAYTGTTGTPRYTYMDITATMTSVNKAIPAAPILNVTTGAGWYSSQYVFRDVISQSSGRVYKPKTDAGSAFYLPPGMYTIRASGWIYTLAQWNGIWADYNSNPINFNANTTVQVSGAMTTRTVNGSISNWSTVQSTLGITTTATMSFYGTHLTNSNYSFTVYCNTDSLGNGTFTQLFPDGIYTAAVLKQQTSNGQVGLQNLTLGVPFTISSANTTVTLTAPTTINTLSGTASFAGGTLPQGAFTITASDTSLPNFGYTGWVNPLPSSYQSGAAMSLNNPYYPGLSYIPRSTYWTQNTFGGSYSTLIGAGSNYKMKYSFTVYNTSNASTGIAVYAPTSGAAVAVNGDTQYDFDTLPALGSLVTVSGNITGYVGGTATVIARCEQVLGADGNVIPGLSYYTYGTANASGAYSLSLLPGYNYQLYYNTGAMQIYQ